ncbi:MAG: pyridoxal phosphate-dependent aminotransferase [Burkholderiales bacterium]|nr:pyridoxal phosphate-dependent aminotransferase [Burkholderiales bacterium]
MTTGATAPALPPLAARMADIESFYAMEIMREATALEAAGASILYLCVGEPDFTAPAAVMDAADAAARRGETHYTVALGIEPLRQAIAGFYRTRYGFALSADRVAVTAGASGALLIAFGTMVNPGDEWLMPDPTYPCNRRFVSLYGGTTRLVPCGPENGYQLTPELVRRHWGPRTRGVMIASPSNPTGTTVAPDAMRGIHAAVREHGGALLVDEIYHGLTYDRDAAGRFVEERTALELGEDVFVVNSFSKYFHMTGWRLGWLVAPPSHHKAVEKLAQNLFICPPTIAQHAALTCFTPDSLAIYEARRAEFAARRDYLVGALRSLGFGIPQVPQGAFYVYADVSRFSSDSFAFCFDLLKGAGVAITPGRDFGDAGAAAHVRFTYTVDMDSLAEVVRRLHNYLNR